MLKLENEKYGCYVKNIIWGFDVVNRGGKVVRMKEFAKLYWKQKRWAVGVAVLFFITFAITYLLYQLPFDVLAYQLIVCVVILVICCCIDIVRSYKKYRHLFFMKKLPAEMLKEMPQVRTLDDKQYQEIIELLLQETKQQEMKMTTSYQDMMDYYATWVHQIKTPIASMKLHLQNEDTEFSRRLSEDLFRVEQYVEMVLMYLRLDTEASDYVFKEYELDDVVRQSIRKFASQFIRRRLSLDYQPLQKKVLTDEKWLAFVLEQILSNAIKYTPQGGISIMMESEHVLCMKDTGMGIAPENLPRIFEKGYTGYNGRTDKSASGIGLYLCKRICEQLGHRIWVESVVGEGTSVKIDFSRIEVEIE